MLCGNSRNRDEMRLQRAHIVFFQTAIWFMGTPDEAGCAGPNTSDLGTADGLLRTACSMKLAQEPVT
jgi:hypothetical protein